jgi:hypothetical protein
MNNERDKPEFEQDDRLVSTAYRDVAGERAPEHLNHSILQQAATTAKPRYARSMSWMRPMAWAATIGLSLAIVLEITQVPQPQPSEYGLATDSVIEPAETARERKDVNSIEILEESVPQQDSSVRIESDSRAKADTGFAATARLPAAQQPVSTPAMEKKLEDTPMPAQARQKASKPMLADTFYGDESDDDQVAGRENSADPLVAGNAASLDATQLSNAPTAAMVQEKNPGCDAIAVETPESWHECVAALAELGFIDEANDQLEQLKETFPNFVVR